MTYAQASSQCIFIPYPYISRPISSNARKWSPSGTDDDDAALEWIRGASEEKMASPYSKTTQIFFLGSVAAFIFAVGATILFSLSNNQIIQFSSGASLILSSICGFIWIELGKKDVRKNLF
jgi:hypothetical protein